MKYRKMWRAGHMTGMTVDKECIQNFVQETSCKTPTWTAEKEMREQHWAELQIQDVRMKEC